MRYIGNTLQDEEVAAKYPCDDALLLSLVQLLGDGEYRRSVVNRVRDPVV